MTTSKLIKSLIPDLQKDFIGVNADVMTATILKSLALYDTQKLLKIESIENSGSKRSYYLMKRPSKKIGYIYQVRYRDPQTNQILPTKYSTNTNDLETAVRWAEQNKERCLTAYNGKAELTTLKNYYCEGSKYLEYEAMNGRKLSNVVRKQRQGFMTNHIIPFFQSKKVHYLSQMTPLQITKLKNYLTTEKHLTPQTINIYLHSFKLCLALLQKMGKISVNFDDDDFSVKGSSRAVKTRNTFEMDTLKGVFNKEWNSELSKLLCMVIYFLGILNSEIQRMRFNDIEKINDVYFLNVRGTKSKSAKRKGLLNPVLYNALEKYVKENGIDFDTPIFENVYNNTFRKASFDMGSVMNHTESELLEKGICFYSGRHTYCSGMAMANVDKIAGIPIEAQQIFGGHSIGKKELEAKGIKQYNYMHFNSDSVIYKKSERSFEDDRLLLSMIGNTAFYRRGFCLYDYIVDAVYAKMTI